MQPGRPANWNSPRLYAAGHISNTKDINLTFVGNPTLIPEDFYGWYVQAGYRLLEWDGGSLRPFVHASSV